MKVVTSMTLSLFLSLPTFALDGTTNPPDKGSGYDTTIMGGGTPGGGRKSQFHKKQNQEEKTKSEKNIKKEDITDQNRKLDGL